MPFDGGCGSRRAKPYSSFALTFFPVLKGPEQRPTTGLSMALSISDVRPKAEAGRRENTDVHSKRNATSNKLSSPKRLERGWVKFVPAWILLN